MWVSHDWVPLEFWTLIIVHTELPAINRLPFIFSYPSTSLHGSLCSWVLCFRNPQFPVCTCLPLHSWGGSGWEGAVWPVFAPIRWIDPRRFVDFLVCYVFYLLLGQCSFLSSLYGEPETRSQHVLCVCVCCWWFLFFTYHESCKTQIPWWCSTLILLASLVYPSIKYYDFF